MRVSRLYIPLSRTDEHFGICDFYGDTLLGVYKTKERSLEVLDEIHQRLIDLQTLEIIKEITPSMKKRNVDCIYQMPEE